MDKILYLTLFKLIVLKIDSKSVFLPADYKQNLPNLIKIDYNKLCFEKRKFSRKKQVSTHSNLHSKTKKSNIFVLCCISLNQFK